MQFVIEYWYIIVALAAVVAAAGMAIRHYFGLPSTEQMDKIRFEVFSLLVDDALEDMRKMLENNMAVRAIVNGEDTQND